MDLHFSRKDRRMSRNVALDHQRLAQAAMKMAAATSGLERLQWVRVAQAWHDLGRNDIELGSGACSGEAKSESDA
jgi:hypothetical protein